MIKHPSYSRGDFEIGQEVYVVDQDDYRFRAERKGEIQVVKKIGRKYITIGNKFDMLDAEFCISDGKCKNNWEHKAIFLSEGHYKRFEEYESNIRYLSKQFSLLNPFIENYEMKTIAKIAEMIKNMEDFK